MSEIKIEVIARPGTYFLCDPCFHIGKNLWREILISSRRFLSPVGKALSQGKIFEVYAFDTLYGDGLYTDQDNYLYPVDSGMIGLVPKEIMSGKGLHNEGRFITFNERTLCKNSSGLLSFGEIIIDTRDLEEE